MTKLIENKGVLVAGLIIFSSFLLVFFSYLMQLIFKENAFQVKQVAIVGEYSRVDISSLETLLEQYLGAGFFVLNTEKVKQNISDFPWVKNVKVTRVWPNKLAVEIIQKKVIGRWGKGGYVDEDGQLFFSSREPRHLPEVVFSGDEKQLLKMVAIYNQVSGIFNRHGKKIAIEHLDHFGTVMITTLDGQKYTVGDKNYRNVIREFFESYSAVVKQGSKNRVIEEVDMRYDNGFAIKWTDMNKVGA